jgi:hypothetical protein
MTRLSRYRDELRDALLARVTTVEGGPLDGTHILSEQSVYDALAATEYPPVDAHSAEVATPATVTVVVTCPICREPGVVLVNIGGKVGADDKNGGVLSAKVDAGHVTHLCGQLPLPIDVTPPEQESFDLTDIPPLPDGDTVEAVVAILGRVDIPVTAEEVEGWTEPQRQEARRWAVAYHVARTTGGETPEPPAHVPAPVPPDQPIEAPDQPMGPPDHLAGNPDQPDGDPNPPAADLSCPWPGCVKPADHGGRHSKA